MQLKSLGLGVSILSAGTVVALLAGCGGGENASPPAPQRGNAIRAIVPIASVYQVIHRFGGADGADVEAGVREVNRLLYGTTAAGGAYDRGTFYRITQGGDAKVLYNFGSGADGAKPQTGIVEANGTFYGTTEKGGSSKLGTVYSMKVLVRGIGVETVLHSFTGYPNDGELPFAGLVDVNGTLYGTTFSGGSSGDGTVFSISTSGKEKVIHNFAGDADGAAPYSGLTDVNGTLYGVTSFGGAACPKINRSGCGTVFSITPAGDEKVLYSFTGGSDGAYPVARLIDVKGTLYGTTLNGGAGCRTDDGCGTVFSVTTAGTEMVLHRFTRDDGNSLYAGLTNGGSGTLYGATFGGGTYGRGVIYSISTTGTEKSLHEFRTDENGSGPMSAPIVVNGTLYGTTDFGGGLGCNDFAGCGTVYTLSL